jgi:putative transposase
VRAGLVPRAADWPWSSAPAHLGRIPADGLTAMEPVLSRTPDFAAVLAAGEDETAATRLRRAEQIGRPLCGRDFLDRLERESGRPLAPARRGRKPAQRAPLP